MGEKNSINLHLVIHASCFRFVVNMNAFKIITSMGWMDDRALDGIFSMRTI